MTESEYARRLAEIDRLLNDPDTAMDARKVWSLLADVADHPPAPPRHTEPDLPEEQADPRKRSGRQRGPGT